MEENIDYWSAASLAGGLGPSVQDAGAAVDFLRFIRIRRELDHFLMNLNYSRQADGTGQQIHFLFLALEHLENMDREIAISEANEEILNLEKIHHKIRNLKIMILNYIRYLTNDS